jgi:hypothetical protein
MIKNKPPFKAACFIYVHRAATMTRPHLVDKREDNQVEFFDDAVLLYDIAA